MKKLLLITLFSILLFAQNPTVYSALGDNIYNNVESIRKLQTLPQYDIYIDKINKYVVDVSKTNEMGFRIQAGDKSSNKGLYLKSLRKLAKTNDFFKHSIKNNFEFAIKNEDNQLFMDTVNSGLINTTKRKKIIKIYYYAHQDDINATGTIIQDFIDEDNKNKKPRYKGPSKAEIQAAKMKRIRLKDKLKQEEMQHSLEDELKKKKVKIRETQKAELESSPI